MTNKQMYTAASDNICHKWYDLMDSLKENPLLLKAALLCHGLKKNENSLELFSIFNPYNTKRTGNVGVHFKINDLVVNAILFDSNKTHQTQSPFELKKHQDQNSISWVLFQNGQSIQEIELITPPKWYGQKTSTNYFMGELFLSEGDNNLMGSLGIPCRYFNASKQCHFCAYTGSKVQPTPRDFSETIHEAYKHNKNITVTITSGNSFDEDRGISNYYPYLESIKNLNTFIPVQIECSPPKTCSFLDQAIDLGVSSFSINFELLDDEIRKKILPAKNEIPKEEYIRSWEHVQKKLGCGKISSAIIFGIEPPQNTLIAAKWLISQGVRPNVIPLKPHLGSKLKNQTIANFVDYYEICKEIAGELKKRKIPISQRLGCSSCGGCNLEGDRFFI